MVIKRMFLAAGIALVFLIANLALAFNGELLLRQAQEDSKGAAAVEAYLDGNVLEVKVSVRMLEGRPTVDNVTLNGPKLGSLVPADIKQVYASIEKEPPYETIEKGGFISFDSETKSKNLKGGVSRKLVTFVIPKEKMLDGKQYYIRVKVNSAKQSSGKAGKSTDFKFYLDKLPEML